MIIQRLNELAVREQLLDDPAFESHPIKFAIQIATDGRYLGISELIGDSSPTTAGKPTPNRGKSLSVPLAHGSPNAAGFARFFADTLARVLPITFDLDDPDGPASAAEREKRGRSRGTFWKQIDEAADKTDDPALRAIQAFGRLLCDDDLVSQINSDARTRKATGADRCTFAWADDLGTTILEREEVKAFFVRITRSGRVAKRSRDPSEFARSRARLVRYRRPIR